jgi:hypothetical protein
LRQKSSLARRRTLHCRIRVIGAMNRSSELQALLAQRADYMS